MKCQLRYNNRMAQRQCRSANLNTRRITEMKKIVTMLLVVVMVLGLAACGSKTTTETKAPTAAPAATEAPTEAKAEPDTIVIMAPPVTGNYLTNLKTWADDFHALYPNLTVEIIETSWGDHNDKLSTMAQAGEAPDIAEISSNALGTYVEMGVADSLVPSPGISVERSAFRISRAGFHQ